MSKHLWKCRDRVLDCSKRSLLMGIVNVTPDSFSDGGQFFQTEQAVQHALELLAEGADILDIGGESSRPGAEPVSLEEELQRVIPVVQSIRSQTDCLISIDTTKAEVARQCLELGVHIINDITALRGDALMPQVVKAYTAGLVLMHMQGTPKTMQISPSYQDVVEDTYKFFEERITTLQAEQIDPLTISIDPGIGFGKTLAHTLQQLKHLKRLQNLDRPVCLGVSRKGFIGQITGRPRNERVAGSLAVACHGVAQQAVQVVRVHDVAATRDMILMCQAIQEA